MHPKLRYVEMFPYGSKADPRLVIQDPEGLAESVVLPYGAALLAALMNGRRTLTQLQTEYKRRLGSAVSLADLKQLIAQLDEAYLLETPRFRAMCRKKAEEYRQLPVRPAVHAGGAYAQNAGQLKSELSAWFTDRKGPGRVRRRSPTATADGRLCGIVSPHIDPYRGGPAFAWAYKRIAEETSADVFVIFGTSHNPLHQWFAMTRKDFDTPLGAVPTDRPFVDRVAEELASSVAGRTIDPFADEVAHRQEHSIEFQAVFLQYVLGGRRPFTIVPILVGSFHEFIADGSSPADSPEIQAFVAAIRRAAAERPGRVCYISGADLAHIGQRFDDEERLQPSRLAEQAADDRILLDAACRGDSAAWFQHVADQQDRNRICGLSPTYLLLETARPTHGKLLAYDQAVEPDGTACVSFASLALYRE